MSNEDSLHEVKDISYYRDEVLSMMNIYNQEIEGKFYIWLNKFEYVTDKIHVPDDKMSELLIAMVDNNFNGRLRKKYSNVNISKLSYKELISQYSRYFNFSNELNLYRKRFKSRNQYEKETIENYADNLRKMCNKCHYRRNKDKILCEQFVKGIRDNVIRSLLSKTPRSSFDEKVAKAIEFLKSDIITFYVDEALLMMNSYYPPNEGEFYDWLNKFEYVADSIGVLDDRIVELFNAMVYNVVHMDVMNSFPAVNFSKLQYDQIIDYYLRHFSPCEVDLHSSRLTVRKQYDKETIRNYADSLLKINNKCYYKFDKDSLCNLFISGLRDKVTGCFVKNCDELSFNETVAKAIKLSKWDLMLYLVDKACQNINIYNPENEGSFHAWFNTFEYLVVSLGVPDDKMIEFFNEMVHEKVHKQVRKASPSINFCDISYDEIIEKYLLYFSEYFEYDLHRRRFFCRKQYKRETITEFSENLKRIYNKFNYKRNRDYELCAQFINGIFDNDIKILLSETRGLSFNEMVAKATQLEMDKIFQRMNIETQNPTGFEQ